MIDGQTVVRDACIDDARAIADVQVSTWRVAYRGIISDHFLDSFSVNERAVRWDELLRQPNELVLVAVDAERRVVEFVSGGHERTARVDYLGELYGARYHALYAPADWVVDNTPLTRPLRQWAELWGVGDDFDRAIIMRAIEKDMVRRHGRWSNL